MKKGIDVSVWQGNIDFTKVKASGIDFVIIRAGYGRYAHQVDKTFERNYKAAKAAGLLVGAYWYSYAESAEDAVKEAQACMEVIKGKKLELPVFLDMEEKNQFVKGQEVCSSVVRAFCDTMISNGYKTGLYISLSPLMNHISADVRNAYTLWIAQYFNRCQYEGKYAIWQYSDSGKVDGISGNVDMNHLYDESIISDFPKDEIKKTNEEIADEVIAGKWGNGIDRVTKIKKAGYNYDDVQKIVNQKMQSAPKKTNEQVADEVINGLWGNGNTRKERLTKAGYDYNNVQKIVNQKIKSVAFRKNDVVRVKTGAKDYTGKTLDSFVFNTTFYIVEISGNRAVIGLDGRVTAAVNTKDLVKI